LLREFSRLAPTSYLGTHRNCSERPLTSVLHTLPMRFSNPPNLSYELSHSNVEGRKANSERHDQICSGTKSKLLRHPTLVVYFLHQDASKNDCKRLRKVQQQWPPSTTTVKVRSRHTQLQIHT